MKILIGFVIGISLGAILSWADNGFKPSDSWIWEVYLILGIISAVIVTLID